MSVVGDVVGVTHDRDLPTGVGGQLVGRLLQRGVGLGAQVGRVRVEQDVRGQGDGHRLARHPGVGGPVHRGGEGLQRHRVRTALGVVDVLQRLLGVLGQLSVADHRHALEQTRLRHQHVDGAGVNRLEQGMQRDIGLLVHQQRALGGGLEGLLDGAGIEVHQPHTISPGITIRAVPHQVQAEAGRGRTAGAGLVQVHSQRDHHDVVGDHGRPHRDLQGRPNSRHRPGHTLTRTTRGSSRARRRRRGPGRARSRTAGRRRTAALLPLALPAQAGGQNRHPQNRPATHQQRTPRHTPQHHSLPLTQHTSTPRPQPATETHSNKTTTTLEHDPARR